MADFFSEDNAPQPLDNEPGTPPAPAEVPPVKTAVHTLFDYVELFALTVVIILLATLFLFRHAIVDGDSMNNTLKNGEHLIISDLFYEPKYGDIVVFELSDNPTYTMPLIKRVIATEGQTVEIHRDGVYVDGTYLEEDYVYLRPGMNYLTYGGMNAVTENGETFYRYHVGEGEIFVMGDNRFNSSDGRVFGPISVECVLGRVLFRFSPLSKFGRVE